MKEDASEAPNEFNAKYIWSIENVFCIKSQIKGHKILPLDTVTNSAWIVQIWLNWLHWVACGFYALQSRVSYEMYLEPLKHTFFSQKINGICDFI